MKTMRTNLVLAIVNVCDDRRIFFSTTVVAFDGGWCVFACRSIQSHRHRQDCRQLPSHSFMDGHSLVEEICVWNRRSLTPTTEFPSRSRVLTAATSPSVGFVAFSWCLRILLRANAGRGTRKVKAVCNKVCTYSHMGYYSYCK